MQPNTELLASREVSGAVAFKRIAAFIAKISNTGEGERNCSPEWIPIVPNRPAKHALSASQRLLGPKGLVQRFTFFPQNSVDTLIGVKQLMLRSLKRAYFNGYSYSTFMCLEMFEVHFDCAGSRNLRGRGGCF